MVRARIDKLIGCGPSETVRRRVSFRNHRGITHTVVPVAPVGNRRKPWKGLFLVDSGASTSMAPRQELRRLGIRPIRKESYELADGTKVRFDVGAAMMIVKGVPVVSEVIFGPEDAEPILGALTMQSANLIGTLSERNWRHHRD